jgi:hypothetical protein
MILEMLRFCGAILKRQGYANLWTGGGEERPHFSAWNFNFYKFPMQNFSPLLPGNVDEFYISSELRCSGLLGG